MTKTPSGIAKALGSAGTVLSVATLTPDPVSANLLTRKDVKDGASQTSTQAVGSSVSAGSIDIRSGRDTTINGSTLVADNDVIIEAGRNLTIESAQSTSSYNTNASTQGSGNVGSFWNPAIGRASSRTDGQGTATVQVGSQVASLDGNVKLTAGGTYTQTASDVMALGAGPTGDAGNIDIAARNVVINEAYDTASHTQQNESRQLSAGGSVKVPLVDAVRSFGNTVQATGRTGDSRMQALGAVTAASQASDLYAMANSANYGGIKATATLTNSHNESSSTSQTSTVVGSSVWAAGNVNIRASGGGEASNISVTGSTVSGIDVTLDAENAVTLQSAQDTYSQSSQQSGSSQSFGVGIGIGAQTGVTFEAGASRYGGTGNSQGNTQVNTYIDGVSNVTVRSGGNTTLAGAVVTADHVKVDVGGNLNIESRQDTATAAAKESSAGASVSVCIPPICVGPYVMGSVSGGNARGTGSYASVNEQSGIQAGDGGFDVNVKGNTNLSGGVIASTDTAVDGGKNSFNSASLTMNDIVNSDSFSANGASLTAGYNTTSTAGVGSASSGRTSVTTSGISGVAGNSAVRTGDGSNGLVPDWTPGGLLTDVKAQVAITAAFGQQATSEWGNYANGKFTQAVAEGDEEAAACWGPDGACRAAGHAAIGGLTGGIGGAVGAGASSLGSPVFIDYLRANDVPEALVQALAAGAAAGLGGALGGASGAAGGFNEAMNNAVAAAPLLIEALVAAGEAAILACARSPKCVAVIGATVLNALTSNSSQNQDGSGNGSGPAGGNQADTYGTPPNGASPPPEDDANKDVKVSVRNQGTTNEVTIYETNGQSVQINSGHGFGRSHASGDFASTGLTKGQVEFGILDDVVANKAALPNSALNVPVRSLNIDGVNVGYRAFVGPGGRVYVSTYFPI